jgi:hypothetical protein
MAKRIWILGAGFSQPLGGPLLEDFFRPGTQGACRATFPSRKYHALADHLFALQIGFHWGREQAGYWDDAEEFLGFIEDAYGGDDESKMRQLRDLVTTAHRPGYGERRRPLSMRMVVRDHPNPLLRSLDKIARRTVAAQCEAFLFHRDPATEESWSPFLGWARSLDPATDAVITFNYDRVLQKLDPRLQILLPGQAEEQGKVPVFRLHGGVDWALQDDKIVVGDVNELLKSQTAQIAIAAPGRGKAHFVAKRFQDLWNRAEGHLSKAETVLFIGYGFPKSDSEALRRILGALKQYGSTNPIREFHIVLGPETTAATRRVVALLQSCTAGRSLQMLAPEEMPSMRDENDLRMSGLTILMVKQHPLWTQDFLGDWQDRIRPITVVRQHPVEF